MNISTRRNFIKIAGLTLPGMFLPDFSRASGGNRGKEYYFSSNSGLTLGIASYTFREFSLEETIKMTNHVGIDYIAFKSMHLPLDSSDQEIQNVKSKVNAAGLTLYGAGVIYMNSSEEVENAFHYAGVAGMRTIIGVPQHDLLDLVEKKVKETNIQVAIHNHGPGDDLYPSPESIMEKVSQLDQRIGICMDIGHTQRIGLDPADQAEKYFDRLLDIHLKDVDKPNAEGETVEIGRGIIDMPKFLNALLNRKYAGIASFEYEKDAKDPLAGLAESIGYVKGVLAVLNK
jgi:sugar phosphate isomerase/epimerase